MAFTEVPNVNIPILRKLHTAHIKNIPFETLDIFLNKRFTLMLSDLYDKIVTRRRGGYCYELNGLFFYLLQQLGFEASIHSAHLYDSNEFEIKASQHMVLLVNFQGDCLVDVGYGNGFIEPLPLDNPQPQEHKISQKDC